MECCFQGQTQSHFPQLYHLLFSWRPWWGTMSMEHPQFSFGEFFYIQGSGGLLYKLREPGSCGSIYERCYWYHGRNLHQITGNSSWCKSRLHERNCGTIAQTSNMESYECKYSVSNTLTFYMLIIALAWNRSRDQSREYFEGRPRSTQSPSY